MAKNILKFITILFVFLVFLSLVYGDGSNYTLSTEPTSIPDALSSAINGQRILIQDEDYITVYVFESRETLIDNLKAIIEPVDQKYIKKIEGKYYSVVNGRYEWLSGNNLVSIDSSDILNGTLTLYPNDFDPNELYDDFEETKESNMILTATSSSPCDDCGAGLWNVCDQTECWDLGSTCYSNGCLTGTCCYDGDLLYNGDTDYCVYKGQRLGGCTRNEYDCDSDGQCLGSLICQGPLLDLFGNYDGCCYDYEDWDENLKICKTINGNTCSQDNQCLSNHCVHGICRETDPYCGDDYCDSGENYDSCFDDCIPPVGNGKYCLWKYNHGQNCARNEWDCDQDYECTSGLVCVGPLGDTSANNYDGCCYDYEDWDTTSHSCYDPRLQHDEYDCDSDSDCSTNLLCEGQGYLSMTDGCCYDYENWDDVDKDCKNAIYGTVYEVTTNPDGSFTERPFSNLEILFEIHDHAAGPIKYDSVFTDSNGIFYFNPEHAEGVTNWNTILLPIPWNWQVDKIYAVQNNEVIGEWTNNFNNGFWGGLDTGYRLGSKSRHQIVRIHTDMEYWKKSSFETAGAQSLRSMSITSSDEAPSLGFSTKSITPPEDQSPDGQPSLMIASSFTKKEEKIGQLISVRSEGTLIIDGEGEYQFGTNIPGGVRLIINSQPVFEEWSDNQNYTERNGSINLLEGNYSFTFEFYQDVKTPNYYFYWIKPGKEEKEQITEDNFIFEDKDYQYYDEVQVSDSTIRYSMASSVASTTPSDTQDNYQVSFLEDPKVYYSDVAYNLNKRPLVLVHGMHGKSGYWDYLEDHLTNDKLFEVWQFYYPGDQENNYSAALLKDGLDYIKRRGYTATKFNIVAHSMGTLVSRGYMEGLAKLNDGTSITYGNNVNKIVLLGGPMHGSYLSNRALQSEPLHTTLPCFILDSIFGLTDVRPDEPAMMDLAVGSEYTWNLANTQISNPQDYLSIAGTTDNIICVAYEAEVSDDLVALTSASLLEKNIPLVTMNKNHANEKGDSATGLYEVDPTDVVNIIYAFLNNQGKTVIESYLDSGEHYIDPQVSGSNPFDEGSILLKFINYEPTGQVSLRKGSEIYYLNENSFGGVYYYFSRCSLEGIIEICTEEDGLTVPEGNYDIYIGGTDTSENVEIKPAQTTTLQLSDTFLPYLVDITNPDDLSTITDDTTTITATSSRYSDCSYTLNYCTDDPTNGLSCDGASTAEMSSSDGYDHNKQVSGLLETGPDQYYDLTVSCEDTSQNEQQKNIKFYVSYSGCAHAADTNCNGCVSLSELISYIQSFMDNPIGVGFGNVINAIKYYIRNPICI